VTAALLEQRAIATTAQASADELEQLERDLMSAGAIRAWKLARQRRRLVEQPDTLTEPQATEERAA
jgi:hypothetical protein